MHDDVPTREEVDEIIRRVYDLECENRALRRTVAKLATASSPAEPPARPRGAAESAEPRIDETDA